MMIYIDPDYKCFTTPADGRREVETDFFNGKCKRFIEGYRYIPDGETWTRSDGEVFTGIMIAPWRDNALLAEFQAMYEEALSEQADMTAALNMLGVNADG